MEAEEKGRSVRVARWVDEDGVQWAGTEDDGMLTPAARVAGDREGDEQAVAMAFGRTAPPPIGDPVDAGDVRLLAPVRQPGALRDCMAFEAHVATARSARGLDMDPAWYEVPVFYFSNPHTVVDPRAVVPMPRTERLDFELEVGIVVGADLRDADEQTALEAIAGYTVFNDFSARDVQRTEMRLGLGPAKAKDFAQGLGPVLVTPDELAGSPDRPEAVMVARVNGAEVSRGNLADLHFGVGALLAHASRDSLLRAGDVVGTGTVGTGCLLELRAVHGDAAFAWLQPGDTVELEVAGIGVLDHEIGPPREPSSA